ncbi:glycosyltransferase [bacterium]|nr:glycosyltransferase [bacterium]
MAEEPLVSIIMNCYNGEKYLKEAIDSIINQSYKNWELIFWDNQSTDNSANILLSYHDLRIKYFFSDKHTLLYEARNLAIEKSKGGYLAFLDVDDYWDSTKLEKQMQVFSNNSEVTIVYSNYFFKNEIKNTFKQKHKNKLPEGMIVDDLLRKNYMSLLTVLLKRGNINDNEKIFDSSLHIMGDYDMAIKITAKCKVCCIQQPLATYRWHGGNESIFHQELTIKELERWSLEMKNNPEISNKKGFKILLVQILYMKAMLFLMKGHTLIAFNYFLRLPFGIQKLKMMISFLLPRKIIQLFRT